MTSNHKPSSDHSVAATPNHPIISDTMHRDTLDRVAHLIELLEQMDLSDGMTPGAQTGLYWVHRMIIDAVRHVSNDLK
jgi:hypothetical protein